ncbi:MAG: radical SAM protein [Planctomycetes bacterium]|nr:radical SAM protein [Planctomycetota bacterium]
MRVLFIYPNQDAPIGFNHGIADMAGVLRARGHVCRVIHMHEDLGPIPTPEQVAGEVGAWNPDVVAISTMTQQFDLACDYSRRIGEALPDIPRVVGGVHCTMVPEEAISTGAFDFMGVGECDYAFADWVDAYGRKADLWRLPNMWVWTPSAWVRTYARKHGYPLPSSNGDHSSHASHQGPALLPAVDGTPWLRNNVGPFPDLETIPIKDYEVFDLKNLFRAKKGWHSVLTSRGCPYKCTYCFNLEVVDRYKAEGGAKGVKEYLRHYTLDRVFEEINMIHAKHPEIKTIIFDDDLFTLNKEYVLKFCARYRKETAGIPYVVNAHVQVFDEEMARALKESGCVICKFGLESGSAALRKDVLFRYMSNAQIERAFAAANGVGLHTSAFVMVGLPKESPEMVRETLEMCSRIKVGRFRWAIFYPFPGTAAYRIAKDLDVIDWEKWRRLHNYFDRSCLKFGADHDFYLERLASACHWYVNALSEWECAPIYRRLVSDLDSLTRDKWLRRKKTLVEEDRELSDALLTREVEHYSLRYSSVMGVHSGFVLWEREEKARKEKAQQGHRDLDYNLE